MKINSYLKFAALLLLMSSFLISCGDDDSAEIGGEADLIGTWELVSGTVNLTVGEQSFVDFLVSQGLPQELADALAEELEGDFIDDDLRIEINEDNTYVVTDSGVTEEEGTWTLTGSQLTIDPSDDSPTTFEVLELTSTTLVVRFEETEEVEIDEEGNTETLEAIVEYTFSKAS